MKNPTRWLTKYAYINLHGGTSYVDLHENTEYYYPDCRVDDTPWDQNHHLDDVPYECNVQETTDGPSGAQVAQLHPYQLYLQDFRNIEQEQAAHVPAEWGGKADTNPLVCPTGSSPQPINFDLGLGPAAVGEGEENSPPQRPGSCVGPVRINYGSMCRHKWRRQGGGQEP